MKLSETAAEVIALASVIRDYWDTELPKRHPNYPVVSQGEDDGPPPPEQLKLRTLLTNLPEEDIYKLALLMYLGGGDFRAEDVAGHFERLKKRIAKPERVVAQLLGKAPLADYLRDAVTELKRSGIDVDELTFAPVNSGS